MSSLIAWGTFYVIAGSAAATLTGLMFVVMTLISRAQVHGSARAVNAFGTPTIVHLCLVLLISAVGSAPWPTLMHVALLLGLVGLGGVTYTLIVIRRTLRQADYEPVLEDWLWHVAFPLIAYPALVVAAILLPSASTPGLFIVGAATALLLFIGIHNAWDDVTYIAFTFLQSRDEGKD